MTSLMMWLAGSTAVVGGGYRMGRARHDLTPAGLYLCLAVVLVGFSAILSAPATIDFTKYTEPFANATRLAANVLAMIAACCVHGLLIHLTRPATAGRAMRRHALVLVGATSVMTALLATAPIHSDPNFVVVFADEPAVLGYVLVFCAYIGAAAANYVRLIREYVRLTDRPWLRAGLVVVQVGAAFGVLWAIGKSLSAGAVFAGYPTGLETAISAILSASCVGFVAIGATMPTWGPLVGRPLRHIRAERNLRELYPLWSAIHAVPELDQASSAYRLPAKSTDEKLTRRVVEIRDGLLLIGPHRDPTVRAEAHRAAQSSGLSDPDCAAAAEAAEIAAALRAYGRTMTGAPSPAGKASVSGLDAEVTDLDAETVWLRRVARAYRNIERHPDIARKS